MLKREDRADTRRPFGRGRAGGADGRGEAILAVVIVSADVEM